MRIALVNPPLAREDLVGHTASMKRVLNITPSLGLGYLAAVLEQAGHQVKVFDCSVGVSLAELLAELRQQRPRLVGLTSTTPAFLAAVATAEAIRQALPEIFLVIGGTHPTAVPEQTMSYACFDAAVVGEGEHTLLEMVNHLDGDTALDLSDVAGLVFRNDGEVVVNPPRPYIRNLDELPRPARHLFPPLSVYHPTPASYRRLPVGIVITSRGCPFQCTFCDRRVFGTLFRAHSADYVLDEVEELVKVYGAREIRFFDDTFTINQRRVFDICDGFARRGLRFPWTCLTRVDVVTKDLLRKMKEAGCWQILYGLESGDDEMLRRLNKGTTVAENEQAVRWAQEVGLSVRADFIVATPGETMESLRRTLEFAKRLKVDYAHFNKFVPFPGTNLYAALAQEGHIFDTTTLPPILDHAAIPYVPEGMTRDELRRFLDRANREFYLRPSHILRRLLATRSWAELWGQVQGGLAVLTLRS